MLGCLQKNLLDLVPTMMICVNDLRLSASNCHHCARSSHASMLPRVPGTGMKSSDDLRLDGIGIAIIFL